MQTAPMNEEEARELLALLEEQDRRRTYDKFHNFYFQDHLIDENGMDISRAKYPKQVAFLNATANYKELALIAPNRSGKTESAAFAIATFAMKDYAPWWEGKRFPEYKPLKIMCVGKTHLQVRDVMQKKLFGTFQNPGIGMIPEANKDDPKSVGIVDYRKKSGTPDALQDLYVRDRFGCVNHIQFMSADSEDDVIKGQELDVVWFDEECLKPKFYDEAYMRTLTTGGIILNTFSPEDGITESIMTFLPNLEEGFCGTVIDIDGKETNKFCVQFGYDSCPHLTEEMKATAVSKYIKNPHVYRAKCLGMPSVGEGQVYPVLQEEYVVDPFAVPYDWPRVYGLDFGWNKTAAVWAAIDPNTDIIYIYSEYYQGHEVPAVHAEGIKARGNWITGVCDPAGGKKVNDDGSVTLDIYLKLGLNLIMANNLVESGILMVHERIVNGGLKVFSTCQNLIKEFRLYRRDDKGKIIKQNDHLLDALRYLIVTGVDYADTMPIEDEYKKVQHSRDGANSITGY